MILAQSLDITAEIIKQVPSLAGVLVVVVLFLRHIQSSDTLNREMFKTVGDEITRASERQIQSNDKVNGTLSDLKVELTKATSLGLGASKEKNA